MNAVPDEPLVRLPARDENAHKGDFGTALIVGGSRGMAGAAALAGMAALRGGAGLVRLAVPDCCLDLVASFEPSYMTIPLPSDKDGRIAAAAYERICELVEGAAVVACGPGLGRSQELEELVVRLYRDVAKPMIVNADGLNALAAGPERCRYAGHRRRRRANPHAASRRVRPLDRTEIGRRDPRRARRRVGRSCRSGDRSQGTSHADY